MGWFYPRRSWMRGPGGYGGSQRAAELFIRWLILAFAVWVAANLVSGIHLSGWEATLIVAAILGLLNLYLRPLLVMLSLPLTLLTLGVFLIVINAILLLLASWLAGKLDLTFHVDGLGPAVLGAIVISIVSFIVNIFVRPASIARSLGL